MLYIISKYCEKLEKHLKSNLIFLDYQLVNGVSIYEALISSQRSRSIQLYPACLFPILQLQNPYIREFPVVQERPATDLKAPKLRKVGRTLI